MTPAPPPHHPTTLSESVWFCFGSTHFCDEHHRRPTISTLLKEVKACPGKGKCPLGIAHAPNGTEHCMGCSICAEKLTRDPELLKLAERNAVRKERERERERESYRCMSNAIVVVVDP